MKKTNIDQSVFKPMEHRKKDKANTVFLKYFSKLNKPKNPFDDVDSFTSQSMREIKPGGNINESL